MLSESCPQLVCLKENLQPYQDAFMHGGGGENNGLLGSLFMNEICKGQAAKVWQGANTML